MFFNVEIYNYSKKKLLHIENSGWIPMKVQTKPKIKDTNMKKSPSQETLERYKQGALSLYGFDSIDRLRKAIGHSVSGWWSHELSSYEDSHRGLAGHLFVGDQAGWGSHTLDRYKKRKARAAEKLYCRVTERDGACFKGLNFFDCLE